MTTLLDRPVQRDIAPSEPAHPPRWLVAGAAAAIAAGVVLRFFVRSQLWLDEALSVNIARLPLGQLAGALKHDGAPPLYYVLLHAWMAVFGTGNEAVRALSGVFAVAALPLLYLAGRRLGGSRMGLAAVLIAASSPFATHYATETRMYSLVAFLVVAGLLALLRAVEEPSLGRLVPVTLVTAALLYTHYWSIYLLAVTGAWLLWQVWRAPDAAGRMRWLRVVGAVAVGGVLFLPWVPTFLYQSAHTGTPWAQPASFGALVSVISEFSGGGNQWAQMLAFVLFSLALLGVFGRAVDHRHVELDLHTRPRSRGLLAVLLGTPALAIAAGMVTGTAFVARYTSVVFPVFCLLVALGVVAFADHRTAAVVLGLATALGLWCSVSGALWAPRTQAPEFATVLKARAVAGDVVVFCPDQLGPSTLRLLDPSTLEVTSFPRGTDPHRVDWVDYGDAVKASSVSAFAASVVQEAGLGHSVWLVAGRGYRPFQGRCTDLVTALTAQRPAVSTVVRSRPVHYFEHATLYRFPG